MNKKSKRISGLPEGKIVQNPTSYFTESEKHKIIQELLETGCTKREIWKKYTGQEAEHGLLLRWMRNLGYGDSISSKKSNFVPKSHHMNQKEQEDTEEETFEILRLQKRIAELEKQVKDAEMKAIGFSTMIDIAEKTFNISIRKKSNTKPSNK